MRLAINQHPGGVSGMGAFVPAGFPVPSPTVQLSGLGGFESTYTISALPIVAPGDRLAAAVARLDAEAAARAKQAEKDAESGLGAWVPAYYPVPSPTVQVGDVGNAATNAMGLPSGGMAGLHGIAYGMSGCGGGCGCDDCAGVMSGLGALSDYLPTLPDLGQTAGIPNAYLLAGGAFLAYVLLSRGSGYREEKRAARAAYSRRVSKARRTYGRGYQRAGDAYREARGAA